MPLYGIKNDTVHDVNAMQNSIKRIVLKTEETLNTVIETVNILCNVGNFFMHKQPRLKTFNCENGAIVTNKFEMKACNAFEVYEEQNLKTIINIFAEIGISVDKIYSPLGLFLNNAREIINNEQVVAVNFLQNTTIALFFDGAGSVTECKIYDFGVSKCIEYVISTTLAHFPYLKQNLDAITLVLQDFVNLSEVEMVDKINRNKQYKREVISLVNYEMAKFISEKTHKYCAQMWENMNIPHGYHKAFITSNTKYTKTLLLLCDLLATQHIFPLNNYLKISHDGNTKKTLWQEITGLLKSA